MSMRNHPIPEGRFSANADDAAGAVAEYGYKLNSTGTGVTLCGANDPLDGVSNMTVAQNKRTTLETMGIVTMRAVGALAAGLNLEMGAVGEVQAYSTGPRIGRSHSVTTAAHQKIAVKLLL